MTLPRMELPQNASLPGNADSTNPEFIKKRQFVRVYYPPDCPAQQLPQLTIRYRNYQILDISEAGLRFAIPRPNSIPDDIIKGTIRFLDESVIEFSGVVVRRDKTDLSLKLIVGIPYSYIAAEQVRLRKLVDEGVIKPIKY